MCQIDKTRVTRIIGRNLRFDLFPINTRIFFPFFFVFRFAFKSSLIRALNMDGNDLLVRTHSEPNRAQN